MNTIEYPSRLLVFLSGILFGVCITLLLFQWTLQIPEATTPSRYVLTPAVAIPDPGEARPEPELSCECIEFVETSDNGRELNGTLCRCDDPAVGIIWVFEGKPAGLSDLYHYLEEGVKDYYSEKQRQRWPRPN